MINNNQITLLSYCCDNTKSHRSGGHSVSGKIIIFFLQLSKVSAAAITKWLKSEGVKCKCKEKKQDLMLKVYQHLDLVQPEP